jgi:hypothetical protein
MPHGLTNFCSTVIKPYYTDDNTPPDITIIVDPLAEVIEDTIKADPPIKQGRGRPKGSKNKQYTTAIDLFLMTKEKEDIDLSHKL